jgi:hypothetical protein
MSGFGHRHCPAIASLAAAHEQAVNGRHHRLETRLP